MRVKLGNASSANAKGYASMYPYLSELAMENVNKTKKLQFYRISSIYIV